MDTFLKWLGSDLLPVGLVGGVIVFFMQNSGMEVLKKYLSTKVEEEKDRLRRETEQILANEKNEVQKVLAQFAHELNATLEMGKARLDVSKKIAERILEGLVQIAAAAAECNAATGGLSNDGSEVEHAKRLERLTSAERALKEAYYSRIVLLDQTVFDECRFYTGQLKKARFAAQNGDRGILLQAVKEAHTAYRKLTSTVRLRVAQLAQGGIPSVGAIFEEELG